MGFENAGSDEKQEAALEQDSSELHESLQHADAFESAVLEHEDSGESEELAVGSDAWIDDWRKKLRGKNRALPKDVHAFLFSEKTEPQDLSSNKERRKLVKHLRVLEAKEKRQDVMHALRQRLTAVSGGNGETFEDPEGLHVDYDPVADGFKSRGRRVTLGDVVADRVWGLRYRIDQEAPASLRKSLQKNAALAEAKDDLEAAFDDELGLLYSEFVNRHAWQENLLQNGPAAHTQTNRTDMNGLVAEHMAESLLMRIQYDHPELAIKLERSNLLEDKYLACDFKIIRTDASGAKRFGVQFTATKYQSVIKKKKEQISSEGKPKKRLKREYEFSRLARKPFDNRTVVNVASRAFEQAFRDWWSEGRPPGGPERFLPTEIRQELIAKLLRTSMSIPDDEVASLANEYGPNRIADTST